MAEFNRHDVESIKNRLSAPLLAITVGIIFSTISMIEMKELVYIIRNDNSSGKYDLILNEVESRGYTAADFIEVKNNPSSFRDRIQVLFVESLYVKETDLNRAIQLAPKSEPLLRALSITKCGFIKSKDLYADHHWPDYFFALDVSSAENRENCLSKMKYTGPKYFFFSYPIF